MKELILVRHAKSSWDNPGLKDFDRPLNDRGNKDVITMSKRLVSRSVNADLLVSSPAKRTLSTAQAFANTLGIKEADIMLMPSLYQALPSEFYRVVRTFNDDANTVLMFTHNTGLTDFANDLTNVHVDNVPTCGIFAIKVDCEYWKDFARSTKLFWFFDYPKLIL